VSETKRQKRTVRHLATLIVAGVLAVSFPQAPSAGAQQSGDADVMLQSAIQKEFAEGDLEGAIEVYEQIVAGYPGQRPLVAQALFRAAACYEKLGREQALSTYEQIVASFADQPEAEKARARLIALRRLTASEWPDDEEGAGIVVRRVWSGSDLPDNGSISLDGRYMAYVDIMYETIKVRDMRTGEIRDLPKVDDRILSGSLSWPVISPDGEWVVFAVALQPSAERCDLWIVRTDGTDPRLLYSDDSVVWIDLKSWSLDGESVLAVFYDARQPTSARSIVSVGVEDGAVTTLKNTADRQSRMSYSPDARFIVYDRKVDAESEERDIYVLTTDTLEETALIERPGDDFVLGWAPDGRHILFAGDRSGAMGAWLQEVDGATAIGEPKLVKADFWRATPVGFTSDGAYYFHQRTSVRDVYRAEIDFGAGNLISGPRPVDRRVAGQNRWPVISPDGRYVAFLSERGIPSSVGSGSYWSNTLSITIHSLETGVSRTLNPDVEEFSGVFWYTDSRSLAVQTRCSDGGRVHRCLFIVDRETGSAQLWDQWERQGPGGIFAISPDGKQVFMSQWQGFGMSTVVREMESGEVRVLRTGPGTDAFALSPDGQYLARAEPARDNEPGKILIIPVAGGAPREVLSFEEGADRVSGIDWTPDMQRLVYLYEDGVWDVPVAGGSPRNLGLSMDWMRSIRVHPDGRQIIFDAEPYNVDIWVMENLVEALR